MDSASAASCIQVSASSLLLNQLQHAIARHGPSADSKPERSEELLPVPAGAKQVKWRCHQGRGGAASLKGRSPSRDSKPENSRLRPAQSNLKALLPGKRRRCLTAGARPQRRQQARKIRRIAPGFLAAQSKLSGAAIRGTGGAASLQGHRP